MKALRSLVYGALSFLVAVCPVATRTARAAPVGTTGDIAIFREATAGDDIPTTDFTHDWDTSVRADGVYALNGGGNTDIQLSEGHHLVLYSSRFDSTGGTNRSEVQSQLALDGTDLATGWSQGYIRRADAQDETLTAGGGIVYVDAADPGILSLQSFRTDANSATIARAADTAGIQILKLNDNADYLRLSLAGNQAGPNDTSTWVPVQYDTQDEVDPGSFVHTGGSEDVMLKKAGHYLVLANTYGERPDNGTRISMTQRLTLDGTEVDGSLTTVYLRGNSNGNDCFQGAASIGTIIETTAPNQVLNVEGILGANSEQLTYIGGRTALTIVKLSDDADYIRLRDSGADDFNPNTTTALGWDTELENDPSFTHNDSQVGVAADDDYLFLAALYDADDGAARGMFWQRWQENGTDIYPYGQTGTYSRNSEVQDVGNWSGVLVDLDSGEYVETVSERLGGGGLLSADINGLQGVSISTMWIVIPELTWDGATHGSGKWGEAKWTGDNPPPPPNFPDATIKAVINTPDTVTVADADQTALKLTITGGGTIAVAPTRRLDVVTDLDAAGGSVVLNNSTLAVGAGGSIGTLTADNNATLTAGTAMTIGSAALNNSTLAIGGGSAVTTLTADGNSTLSAGGSMAVASYSDNGTATALTLAGGAAFDLQTVSTVAGSSFRVEGSSLQGHTVAKPLGNAQTLVLAGGTYAFADVVGAAASGAAPSGNVVAHWAFDDGTGTNAQNAASPGTNDGTLENFPVDDSQWVAGLIGTGALQFDGSDDQVSIVGYQGISGTGARTIAGWIKASDTKADANIMSWGTDSPGQKWIFRVQDDNGPVDGNIRVEVNGGYIVGETVVNDDAWHHVAVVVPDGATQVQDIQLYVDGQPETPAALSNRAMDTVNSVDVIIGREAWNTGRSFMGAMDNLYLYDRALTAAEIAETYATHTPPDFSALQVTVDAGTATLASQCTSDTAFAGLTMKQGGTLATTSLYGAGLSFTGGTTIEAGATDVGFDPGAGLDLGAIDGSAAPNVVITKTGTGTLVLDNAGTDLAATATINAQGGTVVGYHASNPFDEATLKVSGGDFLLSAKPAATSPVTYDNAVVADANGAITAGAGTAGHAGPMTVNLGSGGNGVTINSGNTLTLRTTDNYILNVAGSVAGGNLAVDQGTVNLAGATVEDLSVSGTGQVNLSTGINTTNLTVSNTSLHAGAHTVTVAEAGVMTLGNATYTATTGAFQVTGDVARGGAETLILGGPGTVLTAHTQGPAPLVGVSLGNDTNTNFPVGGSLAVNGETLTYTVTASGGDIWGSSDGCYFACQAFDVGQAFDITALVGANGYVGGSNGWRKGGLMVRDSLNADSRNAFTLIADSDGNGINAQIRPDDNVASIGCATSPGTASYIGQRTAHDTPLYLRLVYHGDGTSFDYYWSEDPAVGWNLINDPAWDTEGKVTSPTLLDVAMTDTIYVGLAVTSHATGDQTSLDFDELGGFVFDVVPTTLNNVTGEGTIIDDLVVTGALAPGSSVGQIDVVGSLALDAAATFDVDVDAALIDLVTVDGDLALAGILSIDGLLTEEEYTIMTYTGVLSGAFDDISDVVAQGMTVSYSLPGAVRITPEP
ncbi:MAG TPA: LamG domain-containing protein, partial [Phycisphaerae bacterium]|nr:LamG domain-containing protein [Phycisphaerae bacterium]